MVSTIKNKDGKSVAKTVNWALVKANAIKNCHSCNGKKHSMNNFWKCFECKKKFCGKCIGGMQWKKGMLQNEEYRHVCDTCKEKGNYVTK